MRSSTKYLVSAIVGSAALAAAVPAQAQGYPQYGNNGSYQQSRDRDGRYDYDGRTSSRYNDRGQANAIRVQIEQLEQRIQRSDGRDRISEREAATLRRAVYNLRQQYRDYSRNGLTQREAQALQSRIQQLRQRFVSERRDDDGRRW
jgi:predicted RNase H-like nuclease (RuvC/YqgF family)